MSHVDEAAEWTNFLIRAETRGPGDTGPALRRVARGARVPAALVWRLRYRKPKDISARWWAALGESYLETCRQRADWRSTVHAETRLARLLFGLAVGAGGVADELARRADLLGGGMGGEARDLSGGAP